MSFEQSCRELVEHTDSHDMDEFWDSWKYPRNFTGNDLNKVEDAVRKQVIAERLSRAKDELEFLRDTVLKRYLEDWRDTLIHDRIADLEAGIKILEGWK